MNVDVLKLRNELKRHRQMVSQCEAELNKVVDKCSSNGHSWYPVEDASFVVEEGVTPRWSRTCEKCGTLQHTYRQTETIVKTPQF
jgi:hypothetical protein